ncbi:uridylate kinase [Paludisphaera sp.]|uniref:amino acid kinase family protein n=1 Tax=Paludisphaera sp. TaxID=2017432 RepID=UPI00301BF6D9
MADVRAVVVKVGGSLLGWEGLRDRLSRWLATIESRGENPVLIAGGGPVVDALRQLDAAHGLGEEASHRLALRGMDATARVLAALVARSRVVEILGELPDVWAEGDRPILAPRRFLEEIDERAADPLPLSWATTSDSIAARVAAHVGARLVLLKSGPTAARTRGEAAAAGYVDPVFPTACAGLSRVEAVDLRDPRWPATRLD